MLQHNFNCLSSNKNLFEQVSWVKEFSPTFILLLHLNLII